MHSTVAVVTMVRDDEFFLKKWVAYYGALFGRENLYVVNHGREEMVARVAEGCNLIGIPGEARKNFDTLRWRLLNNLVAGLRGYYRHVIVGDVDELVVQDPAQGGSLRDMLDDTRTGRVLTPLGLEVVHRTDLEQESIDDRVLGPRRFVQVSMTYSKPCILSANVRLSRGGHFAEYDKLNLPKGLFLFHLKYCDFELFRETLDRRNAVVDGTQADTPREAMIGRHWFPSARNDDATFARFRAMPVDERFRMGEARRAMRQSWRPRSESGLWQFDRTEPDRLHVLPERFHGLI